MTHDPTHYVVVVAKLAWLVNCRVNSTGQTILEVEEPDKEGGITFIFKDNRFLFIKAVDGKIDAISIPE